MKYFCICIYRIDNLQLFLSKYKENEEIHGIFCLETRNNVLGENGIKECINLIKGKIKNYTIIYSRDVFNYFFDKNIELKEEILKIGPIIKQLMINYLFEKYKITKVLITDDDVIYNGIDSLFDYEYGAKHLSFGNLTKIKHFNKLYQEKPDIFYFLKDVIKLNTYLGCVNLQTYHEDYNSHLANILSSDYVADLIKKERRSLWVLDEVMFDSFVIKHSLPVFNYSIQLFRDMQFVKKFPKNNEIITTSHIVHYGKKIINKNYLNQIF